MKPDLSIILPLHNAADELSCSMGSILGQTFLPACELVAVDDGSTDGGGERLSELLRGRDNPRLVLHRQKNAGPAAARNLGLEKSSGCVIAFIDADDSWPRDKLEWQWPQLQEEPCEMVVGLTKFSWEGKAAQGEPRPEFHALHQNCLFGPFLGSILLRRTVFDKIGYFDDGLRTGEDLDFFIRAREASIATRRVERVGLNYRRHSGNMTRGQQSAIDANNLLILKRSLDRRRHHDRKLN